MLSTPPRNFDYSNGPETPPTVGKNQANRSLSTPPLHLKRTPEPQQLHQDDDHHYVATPNSRLTSRRASQIHDLRQEFWCAKHGITIAALEEPDVGYGGMKAGVGLILVDGLADKRISVLTIISDSPAAKSGEVEVGDKIVSINGKNMMYSPLLDVKQAILGDAGTNCVLVLDRGLRRITVNLTRQNSTALEMRIKALEDRLQRMGGALQLERRLRQENTLKRLEGAVRQWRNRDVAAAFECWNGVVCLFKQRRIIMKKVLNRMANLQKAKMFAIFEKNRQRCRRMRIVSRCLSRWCLANAASAFGAWKDKCSGSRHRRFMVSNVVNRMCRLQVAKAFATMKANRESGRKTRIVNRVISRWRMKHAAEAMDAWRKVIRTPERRKQIIGKCLARMRNVMMAKAFGAFVFAVHCAHKMEIQKLNGKIGEANKIIEHLKLEMEQQAARHKQIQQQGDIRYGELERLQAETAATVLRQKLEISELEKIIVQLRDSWAGTQSDLSSMTAERDGLRKEVQSTMNTITNLKKEIRQLEETYTERSKAMEQQHQDTLNRQQTNFRNELTSIERTWRIERETQITELVEKHTLLSSGMKAAHDAEIASLRSEHARALDMLTHDNSMELERLRRQFRDAMDGMSATHQRDISALEESLAAERTRRETAEATRQRLEGVIARLENEIVKMESSIPARIQAAVDMEVQRLRRTHNEEMEALNGSIQNRLKQQKRELEHEYALMLAEKLKEEEKKWLQQFEERAEAWNRQIMEMNFRHKEELERRDLQHNNDCDRIREFSHETTHKLENELQFLKHDLQRCQSERDELYSSMRTQNLRSATPSAKNASLFLA